MNDNITIYDSSHFSIIDNSPKSKLLINDGDIEIHTTREMPNRWHRFWYKILLGWRWESLE